MNDVTRTRRHPIDHDIAPACRTSAELNRFLLDFHPVFLRTERAAAHLLPG
jgi:hypothetical protein